jgi:VanZ family protein
VLRLSAAWLPALAWMALIFWFSSRHGGGHLPGWEIAARKLGHAIGYLVLALLLVLALRRSGVARALPVAAALALAYAVSDEWHQSFVPGRTAAPRDVAIDGAGIAVATAAVARTRIGGLVA